MPLEETLIDTLAFTAQFGSTQAQRDKAQDELYRQAEAQGIYCASLYELYKARAKEQWHGFSVPACNIRTLTYHISYTFHRAMLDHEIGPVAFEIALSEQEYTSQTHKEYASAILAGALKAGYRGPVFLLGDHYQVHAEAFKQDKSAELARLEACIRQAISARFYSIDIDGSTVVNLDLPHESAQQKDNYEVTAHLTKVIRRWQPVDVTIAVGGEIGHIGGVNSTEADFDAFMKGYSSILPSDMSGLSKIALQTGTSHGGTPLPDGQLKEVQVDSSLHSTIGATARSDYGLGGTVQHGASTLPEDKLTMFPETETLEVHLSTGWQNTVYDALPDELRERMYEWVRTQLAVEKHEDMTDEQFLYKSRKKAFGPFKKELWSLPDAQMQPVLDVVYNKFVRVATALKVIHTRSVIDSIYHS